MPLLTEDQRAQVKEHLEQRLVDPVDIIHFTQAESPLVVPGRHECQYCKETRELLAEVSDLSDKIRLTVYDLVRDREQAERYGVDSVPATIFSSQHAKGVIRYFGVPSGYEFAAVLEDLVDLSTPGSALSPDTLTKLSALTQDVHIRVFVTPTCPYCPQAARLAHEMAKASERVTADVIEAIEFPHLAQRYHVMGVPKTVINDRVEVVGAVPESHLITKVMEAVEGASDSSG